VPLGYALRGLGRYDEAAEAVKRSIRIFDGPGQNPELNRHWAIEQRHFLGLIYRDQKRYADARAELTEGLRRREQLYGNSANVFQSLMELGYVERQAGDLTAALAYYRRAGAIMAGLQAARARPRAGTVAGYLDALVAAAQAQPGQRDALHAEALVAAQLPLESEVAKVLPKMSARAATGNPRLAAAARELQDAQERRQGLQAALNRASLLPPDRRDPAREEELKAQLRQTEQAIERFDSRLQAEFPQYVSLTRSRQVTLDDLKSALRPGEALLTFVAGREATIVLLVRDGRVDVHRAPLGLPALTETVRRLRETLEPGPDNRPKPFDVDGAYRLYASLLGPLAPRLAGATELSVVPAGPLLSLPLGVLVTRPVAAPADGDYTKVPWLGREVPISVLPSVAALRDLRAVAGRSAAPKPFVGFGDPDFKGGAGDTRAVAALGELCRQGESVDLDLLRSLPRLRESAGELRRIAAALGAGGDSVFTGGEASERKVRGTDLAQFRIVAFATHGLLPGELKCQTEPALVLAPPAAAGAADNGLLDASEIAQLRLDAEWVVLSACNTAGPGGKLGGESLSGLARAFLYAGARALLVSHWAVASRPTVVLTTGMVDAWTKAPAAGKAAALARAQAQLAAARDTSHPFFWAPFILVGQ
jgi:CHAT domain-containing protein